MARFEELRTCADLTPQHAAEAASSSALMRRFLTWAAETARPGEGAPKILLAIGKLSESGWVDKTLYVDITGDDDVTKVSIFADYGFGIRERLLPLARLPVPFDEFVRAVRLSPKLIAPLLGEQLGGSLVLTPPGVNVDGEGELDAISIAEASLHEEAKVTVPPPAAVTRPPPSVPEQSGIHTHPTVRRMVAVRPEALRSGNDD